MNNMQNCKAFLSNRVNLRRRLKVRITSTYLQQQPLLTDWLVFAHSLYLSQRRVCREFATSDLKVIEYDTFLLTVAITMWMAWNTNKSYIQLAGLWGYTPHYFSFIYTTMAFASSALRPFYDRGLARYCLSTVAGLSRYCLRNVAVLPRYCHSTIRYCLRTLMVQSWYCLGTVWVLSG